MIKITPPVIDAYFQHTMFVDFGEREISIFASLLFRNPTQETLNHPEVILKVSPTGIGELSGKIISPNLSKVLGMYRPDGRQTGWQFKYNDWMLRGKKSGEYHIEVIASLQLAPGKWTSVNDIQLNFPLGGNSSNPIQVEAFIKGEEEKLTISVVNPILVNIH